MMFISETNLYGFISYTEKILIFLTILKVSIIQYWQVFAQNAQKLDRVVLKFDSFKTLYCSGF